MSTNLRMRQIQVHENTVEAINRAFDEVLHELAYLRGLQGQVTVHDDVEITGDLTIRGQLKHGS